MESKSVDLIIEQFIQFLTKYATYIGLVAMGLMGRFSYDLIRNKKFTWPYIFGCSGIAILGGYLASVYLYQTHPDKVPLLVPLITMVSNNLVSAIMTIDYEALMKKDWKGAFDLLFKKPE